MKTLVKYHVDADESLFALEERLEKLSRLGDSLELLQKYIDFEFFRGTLEEALCVERDQSVGGRPPYDLVLMLKILILQRFYGLSDKSIEFQINDRLSFQRFLGLNLGGSVPDSTTIDGFRKKLIEKGLVRSLFDGLTIALIEEGVIASEGTIVDATFVEAPRQRNSRAENALIKEGTTPPEWKQNQHRLCQKDVDARWAKKGNEVHYGYKDHVLSDEKSKLMIDYMVTDASVHDSQMLEGLLELGIADGEELHADSAYRSDELEGSLAQRGIKSKIHFKAGRNRPLTQQEKSLNKERSKRRARVEHIFGFMTNSMGGIVVRACSFARNEGIIGLMNLTYNLHRLKILNYRLEANPA